MLLQGRTAIPVKLQVFHGWLKICIEEGKARLPHYTITKLPAVSTAAKFFFPTPVSPSFSAFGICRPPPHTYCVITSDKLPFSFKSQSKKPSHSTNSAGICTYQHHRLLLSPCLFPIFSWSFWITGHLSALWHKFYDLTLEPLDPDLIATSVSSLDFGHLDPPRSTSPWLPISSLCRDFLLPSYIFILYVCVYI